LRICSIWRWSGPPTNWRAR